MIKEPCVLEVKVRNSEIAKFTTKTERNNDLWQYAQRRPLPFDKIIEEKNALHSKELKKKYRGDIMIRQRQAAITSRVSSANSNDSKTLSSREPAKLQASTSRSRKSSATPNTSAASSTPSPTTLNGKRTLRAPDYYGFESSVCSVRDQEPIPAPKRPRPTKPVIVTVIQEEASQPPLVETSFQLPIASPPDPRIQPIGNTSPEVYDYADYGQEVSMSVFEAENQIWKQF